MISSNRQSKNCGPFACRLKTPDDAPDALRSVLIESLAPQDNIRLLIFSSVDKAVYKDLPSTVLAITDHGWIVISESSADSAQAARCNFANTLLVEMTSILLYGLLRIDFAANGHSQSTTMHFNTVTRGLYQEATELVLNGIDEVKAITPIESKEMHPILNPLPLKFCNALLEFTPMGQRVLAVVHWPAVLGQKRLWFRPELAPQAALALTDRELLLISEEPSNRWMKIPKYGSIVTHCPYSRIENLELSEHEQSDTLDVQLRVPQGGEKLKIEFPRERKPELEAFVERALRHVSANSVKTNS